MPRDHRTGQQADERSREARGALIRPVAAIAALAITLSANAALPATSTAETVPLERVTLKMRQEGRRLVVDLGGPSGRRVLVSYTATYEGKRIAAGTKTAALIQGAQTVRFQLSAHVARLATISVTAKFAKRHTR